MRRELVVSVALAFMTPELSLSAVPEYNGQADHMAVASVQADDKAREGEEKKKEEDPEKEKGTLDKFEAAATDDESKAPADSTQSAGVDTDYDEYGVFEFIAKGIYYGLLIGTVGSWYRVTGEPRDVGLEEDWARRQPGEPGIPFAALNFNYSAVKGSDVTALDGRFEGGYGPLGVMYRFTRFEEEDPGTHLDLSWLHGVLRESYTSHVEIGFAFGAVFLNGHGSESGFSYAMPIRIALYENVSLEYRPAWGWINESTIIDQDLALTVGRGYVSLRAGYRWTKAQSATLEGPVFGVLLSF